MTDTELSRGVRFDVPPPDDEPIYLPILSPRPGTAIRGVVLSEHLIGVWTHWWNGRTEPHFISVSGCPGCREGLSKRWRGYFAIDWTAGGRMGLAEITARSLANCPELVRDPFRSVRGWLIEVTRPMGKKNGRVKLAMQPPPYQRDPKDMPDAPDVTEALVRIWSGRRDGPSGLLAAGEWLDEPPF